MRAQWLRGGRPRPRAPMAANPPRQRERPTHRGHSLTSRAAASSPSTTTADAGVGEEAVSPRELIRPGRRADESTAEDDSASCAAIPAHDAMRDRRHGKLRPSPASSRPGHHFVRTAMTDSRAAASTRAHASAAVMAKRRPREARPARAHRAHGSRNLQPVSRNSLHDRTCRTQNTSTADDLPSRRKPRSLGPARFSWDILAEPQDPTSAQPPFHGKRDGIIIFCCLLTSI